MPARRRHRRMPNGIPLSDDADAPRAGPVERLLCALGSRRVRPIWMLSAAGLVVFTCFRAALLIVSRHALEDASAGEIAQCFLTGLRYDGVPIGYAMLPMALCLPLAPAAAFGRRWFRRVVVGYCSALVTLTLFTEVVGAVFFIHFGVRLNWMSMDHLGHFGEVAVYLWNTYAVWARAIGTVVVPIGCALMLPRIFWAAGRANGPLWARSILSGVLVGLCVTAARGGLDRHPLRSARAYFSGNNVINQLAMNNFYTFWHAAVLTIEDGHGQSDLFSFPDADRAAATTAEMLFQPGDEAVDPAVNPLWRRRRSGSPRRDWNVVVIVMEGMSGRPVGALGHSPTHTPNFDRLCREGVFFERMYAVGTRTNRGMTGILCGYPDLIGQSVLKRPLSQGTFLTLGGIFRRRGYRTLFLYGGDPDFDNMREFFGAAGIEHFIGQDEMRRDLTTARTAPGGAATRGSPQAGNWGLPDEVIFREAHETFQAMGRQNFFAVILTVSNHEPYDVPLDRTEMLPHDTDRNKLLNGYRYADWALADFFRRARRAKYFRNTLFVLVADHGRGLDHKRIVDVPGFRVPCLIYAPGLVPARRISTVASQTDIAPTLLGLLGGSYEHCFFGRDLLASPADEGFALLHDGERLAFVSGEMALVLPPRSAGTLFRTGPLEMAPVADGPAARDEIKDMQRQVLSYYQTARQLYLNSSYRDPRTTPRRRAKTNR